MKLKILFSILFCLLGMTSLAQISLISVRQLWPWNNAVEITYEISGEEAPGWIQPKFTVEGNPFDVPDSSFTGMRWFGTQGRYVILWHPERAGLTDSRVLTSFAVSLVKTAMPLYKVYDLSAARFSDGSCPYEYVFEDDLHAGKWGSVATNPVPGVASYVWTGVVNDLYRTTKMAFRYIPTGSVQDEWNGLTISSAKPLWAAVFETTRKQLNYIVGDDPGTDNYPARAISYTALKDTYLPKIRDVFGEMDAGVPSVEQWRYFARAGATTVFADNEFVPQEGTDITVDAFSTKEVDAVAAPFGLFCPFDKSYTYYLNPVLSGSYRPNAWGLYDVHGNLWEWVLDANGNPCVVGGSYQVKSYRARLANAESKAVSDAGPSNGFRLVIPLGE